MDLLISLFPLLVVVATLALIVFVIRLDQRLSRGSQSAGPRDTVRPKQVGLQQTPWELQALDDQVRATSNHQARQDLTQTINRLTRAAGIDDPAYLLNPGDNDYMIAGVIEALERRLELPPLTMGQQPQHFGSPDGLGSPLQ